MNNEPVVIIAIVKAIILVAVMIFMKPTFTELAFVYGVIEGLGTFAQRREVTPNQQVLERVDGNDVKTGDLKK